jgi:eukaryotic-like serine/threonine-protein kinase
MAPDPDGESDSADSLVVEAAGSLEPATPPLLGSAVAVVGPRGRRGPLASGAMIAGRYRLDGRLGEGGMGEVWAATQTITRRRVAMKFLKGSTAMRPAMRQRFLREARAASLLRHASVVDVLDAFELEDGVPVIVMDLLLGETLGARLARDGPLRAGALVPLLLPVVEAVEAAHAMGIVHRDLKPENIFLCSDGAGGRVSVKVLDFGIAKLTAREGDAAESGAITGTGSVVGTPWYMAPEQCYGEKDVDARADIWTLGVILYECLSGQRPVAGAHVGQLVKTLLDERIVPIEQRVPGLAPELSRLIGQMLSRQREGRPRSLAEVREVLSRLANSPSRSMPRASPPGRGPRVALVVILALGGLAWGALQSASSRAPHEGVATASSDLAPPVPEPPSAASPRADPPRAAAPPAAEEPASASVPNASPVAQRTRGPSEPPAPRKVRSIPLAATTTLPAATPAPGEPPLAPKMGSDGGLFRAVPF